MALSYHHNAIYISRGTHPNTKTQLEQCAIMIFGDGNFFFLFGSKVLVDIYVRI